MNRLSTTCFFSCLKLHPVWTQVQDALLSLGYKTNQLTKIKKEFENTELGEDEMLRQALILLAKRNGV